MEGEGLRQTAEQKKKGEENWTKEEEENQQQRGRKTIKSFPKTT
jgi:hypothetical protein